MKVTFNLTIFQEVGDEEEDDPDDSDVMGDEFAGSDEEEEEESDDDDDDDDDDSDDDDEVPFFWRTICHLFIHFCRIARHKKVTLFTSEIIFIVFIFSCLSRRNQRNY